MLPFLKSPSNKPAVALMPAWHPSFRNTEHLPDTKAVRTAFFINGVAIIITVVIAFYLLSSELGLHDLRTQTAEVQAEIDKDKPGSDRAVVMFKKFQDEEKKLNELKDFQAAPVVGSDLLLQFGESLPPKVVLSSVSYRGPSIVLRGSIAGSRDEASGDASAYVIALGKFPAFAGKFESIELTGIAPDPATNRLVVEILLKFKNAKGAKK
ncbi:MAG: hypothetical protein JF599_08195 [Verrucomicrobia bacterium]|nr:hypothetical protein [Verrucomicrobiota bacterium]